jgi:Protein of unknown function (DUF3592)
VNRPKDQWQIAEALVYSSEWILPTRNNFGHYRVVYSYRAGGERYTGESAHYGNEKDSYLRRDDVITIRYCPETPAESYYPDAKKRIPKWLLFLSIEAGVVLAALLVFYFSGGFR